MKVILFLIKSPFRLLLWLFHFFWKNKTTIIKTGKTAFSITQGAVTGVAETSINTVSAFWYQDKHFRILADELKQQGDEYRAILKEKKELLFDSGVVGGELVWNIVKGRVTPSQDIIEAYENAFPNLAIKCSLQKALKLHNNPNEMRGFLSALKGKLFEQKYVEYLNSDNLPNGYIATLANTPIQAGWDIQIIGPNKEIADVFQLKATDSLKYVRDALEKYPDIDVVTTSEIKSQLLLHSTDDINDIIISPFSNEVLSAELANINDNHLVSLSDYKIPYISLALIAFTAYTEKDIDVYKKSFNFSNRAIKALISSGIGHVLCVFTNTWWIGLIGAISSRYIVEVGKNKRKRYELILDTIESNKYIIKRYSKLSKKLNLFERFFFQ